MAQTRAVFLLWRAATGTSVGTSTLEATTGISGRPLLLVLAHGTGNWAVGPQKCTGTTTINDTGFLFVAFGMNRGGLWDGVDSLTLWFFGF